MRMLLVILAFSLTVSGCSAIKSALGENKDKACDVMQSILTMDVTKISDEKIRLHMEHVKAEVATVYQYCVML